MRILLVNDYATPTGGAELQMLALRQAMRERGHDARFFATRVGVGHEDSQADYTCLGTASCLRTLLRTANPWAYVGLRRVLADFRPDVVHVRIFLTQLSPLILPLLRDVPSLYHVVWYRAICPLGTKSLPDGTACRSPAGRACLVSGCVSPLAWTPQMLQLKLVQRWLGAFQRVVANSDRLRELMLEGGFPDVGVIYNGAVVPGERPPLSCPPLVAFAGRLVPVKGADVLLRAFAKVLGRQPEARLLLAGDGPERGRLQRLAASLGIEASLEMTGHLSREALDERFTKAWVQVVPSTWEEPFANAALEAMMRGTAVVASSTGGLPEIVADGRSGILVPHGDVDALARAIGRLLGDRDLADRMGLTGREIGIARFSMDQCVDNLLELYEEMRLERSLGRFSASGAK